MMRESRTPAPEADFPPLAVTPEAVPAETGAVALAEQADSTQLSLRREPGALATESLFRPEAIEARRTQWLGTVLLAPRTSHTLFTLFALVAIAALVSLAYFGEFTRKARVNGWLVPEQGLVRVYASQPGVIGELKVREGSVVRAGDPLIVLSAERQSANVGATEAEIARLLAARRLSLQGEISQQEQLLSQQRAGLQRRIQAIREEIAQFGNELAVQESRQQLAKSSAERMRELGAQGFASRMQVQQQEDSELDQRSRTRALQRARAERQRELVTLQAELADLPFKAQSQVANLERNIAELQQQLAESEARRRIVIEAPQAGTVTSVQADLGSSANTGTPLLNIVPEGARMEAHLFTPSRSIGFVHPGQRVLLRYQAFPYQKFGHAEGEVVSVSRSALAPTELPAQLAGLSALVGSGEPIYRITVKLERQSVTAYGKEQPLQAGMQLESDLLLERRRLYEWVLEPLYTLTGKL
jgi:membrane fusion protein